MHPPERAGNEATFLEGRNVLATVAPSSGGQLFTNAERLLRAVGTKSDSTSLNRQRHLDNLGTVEATSTATQALEADFSMNAQRL